MIKSILCKGLFFILSLFLITDSYACAVDVQIVEGNTLAICQGDAATVSATPGFLTYTWFGPATASGPGTANVTGIGWIFVDAEDAVGCISRDSILISYHPSVNPIVSSSEGVNICSSISGTTLSLDQAYGSYLWEEDGSTNPTLFVTESGEYKVYVTNVHGCLDSASITINFVEFTLTTVGSSTVCAGSGIALEADGGDVYAWSTNEFTPVIVVAPQTTTVYSVTIYQGACFETLSITVDVAQLPPHNMPDTIYVLPGETGYIYGPSDFDTYNWSPSEDVTTTSGASTGFVGTSSGTVTMVATNNTIGCSMTHNTYVKILDITIPEGFSPNGDGINDFFVIPEIFEYTSATLKIWNRWGDVVFESDHYRNEWDGTCQGSLCVGSGVLPEGTYYYTLTIEGRKFDSFLTLKL